MMQLHEDWTTASFDLPPAAPGTGPFPRRDFLRAWWNHRGAGALVLVDGGAGLLPLVRHGEEVRFAGEPDLTDYHTPLGAGIPELIDAYLQTLPPGTRFAFDSLPAEAAELVVKGLGQAGGAPRVEQHAVAAVIELPDSFDAYLAGLRKKDRHELRRKRRRFVTELGAPRIVTTGDPDRLGEFAAMHRRAHGDKGDFMTDNMERFFAALMRDAGAVLTFLHGQGDAPVAAAFGFDEPEGYYLYNSAYAPEAAHAAPGIVLLSALIEDVIASGRGRVDFLKGDEDYKFRLGAAPRPLFVIRGVVAP